MTPTIFPYVLARYASLPFGILDTLRLPGIDEHIMAMEQLEASLLLERAACCDQLFTAIKEEPDNKKRQRLIQLKRDIFNGKAPAGPDVAASSSTAAALRSYAGLYYRKQRLLQDWEHLFNTQLASHRQQLQALTQQELLRSGVLLSSPVLYTQLDSFAAADPSAFRNRELKNEYSLLRYLTRMACKTSPFSTFTYTGIAALDHQQPYFRQPHIHRDINSCIRLNNGLFSYIRALMIHHPVFSEILELQLNVTASVQEAHLCFLINYFNVEAFQRLPAGNLPLWLYNFLRENPAPVATGTLVDILSGEIPDTDRESIRSFLLKLAATGFLELGIGCSAVDPDWDTALMHFLEPHLHKHPAMASLYRLLQFMATQKAAYAGASSRGRHDILQATAGNLNGCLQALQQEAGLPVLTTPGEALEEGGASTTPASFEVNRFAPRYFLPQDIFYEDACTGEQTGLPATAATELVRKADLLFALLEPADGLLEERQCMRDFFLRHYGAGRRVNITEFYHAYYLHEKKPILARKQAGNTPSGSLDIPDTLRVLPEQELVNIHVQGAVPASRGVARGMFVQCYNEWQNGQPVLKGVINAPLPGMGKVAGRFLHLFDPAVAGDLLRWNSALHPDRLLMELNDGSVFNANIHPPLLPFEVRMPGGSSNYPPLRQISLHAVQAGYDPGKDLLALYHIPDGKEIYAYDLCLESFYNRSHFYQLLAHFNPDHRLPLRRLIEAIDRQHAQVFTKQEDLRLMPRIVFEEQLVLRRKGWLVRTAVIPVQLKEETDAAYFIRLCNWRRQCGLPEHVFLFLKSPYITAAGGNGGQLQRDDYKPQYLCFAQPLLVVLFRKLLARAGNWCYFEEMLPHATQLQQEQTVTEYMFHWYKY